MNLYIFENDLVYLNYYAVNDYYYSKLCFFDANYNDDGSLITIKENNRFDYNKLKNEFIFPYNITEAQRCFLLRLVVDAVQLKRGNLPLHASAVSDGLETYIICACSGKGKTYISEEVCKNLQGFNIVGDDHIIISSNYVQGNLKRRIRDFDLKDIGYKNNIGLTKKTDLNFICFNYSKTEDMILNVEESEVKESFLHASAFKYLNEIFAHDGVEFRAHKLIDDDVNEVYKNTILKFLNNTKAVYIQGTQQTAIDYIINQISKGRMR